MSGIKSRDVFELDAAVGETIENGVPEEAGERKPGSHLRMGRRHPGPHAQTASHAAALRPREWADHVRGSPRELRPTILTDIRQADLVEKRLRFMPNRALVTSAHLQATNKIRARAGDSVVSKGFRVWGTEGLYVGM